MCLCVLHVTVLPLLVLAEADAQETPELLRPVDRDELDKYITNMKKVQKHGRQLEKNLAKAAPKQSSKTKKSSASTKDRIVSVLGASASDDSDEVKLRLVFGIALTLI